MKIGTLITVVLTISTLGMAQTSEIPNQIGYYKDINRQAINGYYDIDYFPEKAIRLTYTIGTEYTPGYIFEHDNVMVDGYIKSTGRSNVFKFKRAAKSKGITLNPDSCRSFVVGKDSFTVINAPNIDKPVYANIIDRVDNMAFYRYLTAGTQYIVTSYYVKMDTSEMVTAISNSPEDFNVQALSIFRNSDVVIQRLKEKPVTTNDLPSLIKLYKYEMAARHHRKLYFNAMWDEVANCRNAAYYAIITKSNNLLNISYFKPDNTPLYSGLYSWLYPHHKQGTFTWYYPSGEKRKTLNYRNNIPLGATTYYKNGKAHEAFSIEKNGIFYKGIYTPQGINNLDDDGYGKEILRDTIANREIVRIFRNFQLDHAYYYDENNRRIFTECKHNAQFKYYTTLQSDFSKEVTYPLSSIKCYHHGIVLIRCIVEPKGNLSLTEVIKGIDDDIDRSALEFFSAITKDTFWKAAKHKGKKVPQEVLIPIDYFLKGHSNYLQHYKHIYKPELFDLLEAATTPYL